MKLNIEPFLLDNTLMNACVYLLTAAWLGVRVRTLPVLLASLLGAVYALLSLFVLPLLREPYIKLPAFLIGSLPLFRKAGPFYRTLPFLLLSAATVGGAALLLTLQLGGSITMDGTLMGTVPLRAALLSAAVAAILPRTIRKLLRVHKRHTLYTDVVIVLKEHTYRLRALIDSGNLLTEPLSGLPVILLDREVDTPSRPIPFQSASHTDVLFGERAQRVSLPDFHGAVVDCVCAASPLPMKDVQAILPESVLPQEWRTKHDPMAAAAVGSPAHLAESWQKRYLLVHSQQRRTSGAARPGRGSGLHRTRAV